jgi:hypothetical protein
MNSKSAEVGALCLLVASRDDLCTVAVIDALIRVQAAGGFVGGAADNEIAGSGHDFVATVGARL